MQTLLINGTPVHFGVFDVVIQSETVNSEEYVTFRPIFEHDGELGSPWCAPVVWPIKVETL